MRMGVLWAIDAAVSAWRIGKEVRRREREISSIVIAQDFVYC